jgi:hypothetical protein
MTPNWLTFTSYGVIGACHERLSSMTRRGRPEPDWRVSLRALFGNGRHEATLDGLEPLFERLAVEHGDIEPYLVEVGRRCGAGGHSLDDTAAWISLFARTSSPAVQAKVLSRRAAMQLGGGWMRGHNELAITATVDPFDVTHLRTRLHQEYDRLQAFGLNPTDELLLVVLEAAFTDETIPSSTMAAAARTVFTAGDTVAECPNGRVVVLTRHLTGVANLARLTAARAARAAKARHGGVRVWIETLAQDRSTLDAFLGELTGLGESAGPGC